MMMCDQKGLRRIFQNEKWPLLFIFSKSVFRIAGWIRHVRVRSFVKQLGAGTRILSGIKILGGKCISIGKNCFIGRDVELDASSGEIVIGDNVEIRDGARILSKGVHIGHGVTVGENSFMNGSLQVADGAWIARNCDLTGMVRIGKAILGPSVAMIAGEDHGRDKASGALLMSSSSASVSDYGVVVEDGAWIGHGAILLKDVTVHKNAIIGAGSVVTKDVAEGVVVAGNPAQPIKSKLSL